jgi:phosphoglycolate phosphatase
MLGLDEALTFLSDKVGKLGHRKPPEFHPIEGVASTLEELSACYRLALVTNRSRRHVAHFRDRHPDISRHLDEFVSRQDTRRFKPHPAPLILAARQLRVPIGRCLMVGDSTVDIRAARRAGAPSAAVLCGFGYPNELEQAGADMVLDSVTELAKILGC